MLTNDNHSVSSKRSFISNNDNGDGTLYSNFSLQGARRQSITVQSPKETTDSRLSTSSVQLRKNSNSNSLQSTPPEGASASQAQPKPEGSQPSLTTPELKPVKEEEYRAPPATIPPPPQSAPPAQPEAIADSDENPTLEAASVPSSGPNSRKNSSESFVKPRRSQRYRSASVDSQATTASVVFKRSPKPLPTKPAMPTKPESVPAKPRREEYGQRDMMKSDVEQFVASLSGDIHRLKSDYAKELVACEACLQDKNRVLQRWARRGHVRRRFEVIDKRDSLERVELNKKLENRFDRSVISKTAEINEMVSVWRASEA